jgi:hypothetical protein
MKDEAELADAATRVFNAMPNVTRISPFDHEKACGLVVSWAETGTGFGTLTIAFDKETGETHVDAETMGPEWIGPMLMRLLTTPDPVVPV